MTALLAFAFVSGIVTLLSPCILPVLPIVLSGSVGSGRARPFGIVTGFVVSFTVFTLTLTAIVQALRIPADVLRYVAIGVLVIFGSIMLVPRLGQWFEALTARLASRAGRRGAPSADAASRGAGGRGSGWRAFWAGLPVGMSLGIVWTPCVGPIMASVAGLALTQRLDGGAVFITLAYSLGTSIPMLAIMFGGRALVQKAPWLTRNMAKLQRGFGVAMILVAVAIGFGWDRKFQTAILAAFPNYGTGLTALERNDSVRAALAERRSGGQQQAMAALADPGAAMTAIPAPAGAMTAVGTAPGAAMKALVKTQPVFSGVMGAMPVNGVLADYGEAPQIVAAGRWFNTEGFAAQAGSPAAGGGGSAAATSQVAGTSPLTMAGLRGKVVLVDFWTYSCINCVRTIPYLKAWYDAYRDDGLVIVGVHTPEFEFEKSAANVARAIKDLKVDWPVVQDNDYQQWKAYGNEYWPAHYFIDANGKVRYFQFGEGEYDVGERVIQELLAEAGAKVGGTVSRPDLALFGETPETYLGYVRMQGFASRPEPVSDAARKYESARTPGDGEWSLSGTWTIAGEYVVPERDGTLELGFNAMNVFLVIEPEGSGGTIAVTVDGKKSGNTVDVKEGLLRADSSRVYQLVGLAQPGSHVLRLQVTGKLRLFAFTFG